MIAVAYPTRLRMGELAFVCAFGIVTTSSRPALRERGDRGLFGRQRLLVSFSGAVEGCQFGLESNLDFFRVGGSQTALRAKNPMRPSCRLLGGANAFEFG